MRMSLCTELLKKVNIFQGWSKFGAVREEEEGHKFRVKSRDGIFDTTAAPSHYTVRWVSLQ